MRIIDSHSHVSYQNPLELLRIAREDFRYEKFCALGIPCSHGMLNNLECLLIKAAAPEYAYAYGGMMYSPLVAPSAEDHLRQLKLMLEAGFDGWKILETKPMRYRQVNIPLDSEIFEPCFALAERQDIPITWHAGDPATFWSEKTAPEFAVKNHWLCVGEGIPSLAEIYRQVEAVLDRHPGLRVSLAHLYFTSDDRPHALRMLERYPKLCLDLTPGSEMYADFMADPVGWRVFFETYRDRLVFGTDMTENLDDVVFGSQRAIVDLVYNTLMGDKPFTAGFISGTGLGLGEEVMQPILADNFERIVGKTPKRISPEGLGNYVEAIQPKLNAEDRAYCQKLCRAITERL